MQFYWIILWNYNGYGLWFIRRFESNEIDNIDDIIFDFRV